MMNDNTSLNEEYNEIDGGDRDFQEGEYIFENNNFDYNEEDQIQQEDEVEVGEGCLSTITPTVLWKHVVKGRKCGTAHGGSHVFKCKHCKRIFHGTYTRVYAHLMGSKKGEKKGIGYCSVVKGNINLQRTLKRQVEQVESSPNIVPLKKSKLNANSNASSYGSSGASSFSKGPLELAFKTKERDDAESKIIRCLCANGIPFNVLRSPYWEEMVSAISKVPSMKSPSYEKARTSLLDAERERVERSLDNFKEKWPEYGISIVSDGWTNVKNQPLINILASNQFGSMFLYSHDFSTIEKSGKNISVYLLEAIEKVGPYNVVQVITDNAANCKLAGTEVGKVYPHIFWTPCVVHTLNLLFKDLARALPWLEKTYAIGKNLVKYITNHSQALGIFRNYSKLELLKVATTRFASHHITLKRLLDVREALKVTVVSDQWNEWADLPSLNDKVRMSGENVKEEVMSEMFWDAVRLALSITKPIYKMIKFTNQEGPLIGEIFEAMENMKGEIKENLKDLDDIFKIVDEKVTFRWNKMNVPLQCLAHALTPKYYDEDYLQIHAPGGRKRIPPNQDITIQDGAMTAIFKMHQDIDQIDSVRVQFMSFMQKKGRFSSPTARRDARNHKISVIEWWKFHGGETPELRDMAFKVLSQSVSTSPAERLWSTYSFIHNVKRNRLNACRADKLVYIHSNLRLLSRFHSNYNCGPHRKWDINPELPLMDDSTLKWEDMRFMDLDDEGSTSKQISQSQKSSQEHNTLGINEGVSSSNNQHSGQSNITSFVSGRGGRGGGQNGGHVIGRVGNRSGGRFGGRGNYVI